MKAVESGVGLLRGFGEGGVTQVTQKERGGKWTKKEQNCTKGRNRERVATECSICLRLESWEERRKPRGLETKFVGSPLTKFPRLMSAALVSWAASRGPNPHWDQ